MSINKDISVHTSHVHFVSDTRDLTLSSKGYVGMSTSTDISGHKICPPDVKLISSIRKFHFSSSLDHCGISISFCFNIALHQAVRCFEISDDLFLNLNSTILLETTRTHP